eukprot:TRINITY_DN47641_c0_g1_i1.p1 TRINITY_DN47641_c0_g1~~TRINITY_DN47641_c0_g1_i1.p1  ORF type:complete len:705 (-),score=178.79 TRINITY_DN47641_c0_g1_i1:157-2271(-)
MQRVNSQPVRTAVHGAQWPASSTPRATAAGNTPRGTGAGNSPHATITGKPNNVISPTGTPRSTSPRQLADGSPPTDGVSASSLLALRTRLLQLEGQVETLQAQLQQMPFEVRDLLVSAVEDQQRAMALIQAKLASTPEDVREMLSKATSEQRRDLRDLQTELQGHTQQLANMQAQLLGLPGEVRQFVTRLSQEQAQRLQSLEDNMKTVQLQVRSIVQDQVSEVLAKQAEMLDQASKVQAQRDAALVKAVQAHEKILKARSEELAELQQLVDEHLRGGIQDMQAKLEDLQAFRKDFIENSPNQANFLQVRREAQDGVAGVRRELIDMQSNLRKLEDSAQQSNVATKTALKKQDTTALEMRQRTEAMILDLKKGMDDYVHRLEEWKAEQQNSEIRELRKMVMEGVTSGAAPQGQAAAAKGAGATTGASDYRMEQLEQSLRGHEMAMKQAQLAQQTESLHVRAHLQMQQQLREKDEEIRGLTMAALQANANATATPQDGPRRLPGNAGLSQQLPSPRAPETLSVSAPNVKQGVSGHYDLLPNHRVHDFPIWKLRGGDRWLFSGVSGQWLLGDQVEKNADFHVDTGILASLEEHKGVMPHRIGYGDWQRFDGSRWHEDTSVTIQAVASGPRRLSASAPDQGSLGVARSQDATLALDDATLTPRRRNSTKKPPPAAPESPDLGDSAGAGVHHKQLPQPPKRQLANAAGL